MAFAGLLLPSSRLSGTGLHAGRLPPCHRPQPPVQPGHPLPAGSGNVERVDPHLSIFHVTAEMAPVAKVGGLGDVVTGLARVCHQQGHDVLVCLPFYECLPESQIADLQHECDFDVPKGRVWDGRMQAGTLRTAAWRGRVEGVPVVLLRPDWGATGLFRGGAIYGGSHSELEAYLYFCRAALEYLVASGRQPHVIHAHEWQGAAVPMLYWEQYHGRSLARARCMLTIHNLDSSGECRQDEFAFSGLPGELFATADKALDERTIGHNPERLCLMKGGVVYSNLVTTVSPRYATEVISGGAAGWLQPTFARPDVRDKFHGVLNGIDAAAWDPARDAALPANFSAQQPQGKALCKRYLQQGLGLRVDAGTPLVACITRLVPQKGIHLICRGIERTEQLGGQFVLLGSGHADGEFRQLAQSEYAGSENVKLLVMYSEALSHLIYAAADMVLVPSLFEPCGLTQMIAMRYGAVPVVRWTGGLVDTVQDVAAGSETGNGYCFEGVDTGSLDSALDRAIQAYREDSQQWRVLCKRIMGIDWSWQQSARRYNELYASMAVPE